MITVSLVILHMTMINIHLPSFLHLKKKPKKTRSYGNKVYVSPKICGNLNLENTDGLVGL